MLAPSPADYNSFVNQKTRHQVVIVGGGPVGVALAVELGLRGVSCVLVESRTGLQQIPKGQNLTQRTLEHFYFWGVVDEIRAARLMPPGYPIGEVTAYGNLMSDYWHAPPGRELVRPYYFQDNERLPQYCVEAVLRRKLAELPSVEGRFGWTATTVEQDDAGVRVALVEEGGSGRERWKPTISSAATAAIRSCAARSASSAAEPISTRSWCSAYSARASCTKD